MFKISRRQFVESLAATALAPLGAAADVKDKGSRVVVVHGTDAAKMLEAGVAKMGGWEAFVEKGKRVTVKPNAAWVSRPAQGGNTDPELVGACVAAAKKAGASHVVVPEHPCMDAEKAFSISGIASAVAKAGGKMVAVDEGGDFLRVKIPRGKTLKSADVCKDVLETGCLINMPVAKSHASAKLTLSMKNWMGSVKDRRKWHADGLDQCIADMSTVLKAKLIVLDATRIMLTGGPRGPGKMARPGRIVLGTDPVAVDAYAATLFDKKPFDVPHIRIAHEMKVGCGDLSRVEVVEVKTA